MTVAAQIVKSAYQLEWFLAIEGIGWMTNENDLSAGFDGSIFASHDVNGDLASKLGCTVHMGLILDGTITESLNLRTMDYDPGKLQCTILDVDDFLISYINPLSPTNGIGEIGTDFAFTDTTIQIDNADATFVEGDIAWVAGEEAVLLGTKSLSSGTKYDYTTSTRGYLGTRRGRFDPYQDPTGGPQTWPAVTKCYQKNPFWVDRRVTLWMHVPGESVSNCVRAFHGKLKNFSVGTDAFTWRFSVQGDVTGKMRRYWYAPKPMSVLLDRLITQDGQQLTTNGMTLAAGAGGNTSGQNAPAVAVSAAPDEILSQGIRHQIVFRPSTYNWGDWLRIAFLYDYRNFVGGGTVGAVNAFSFSPSATPQATTDSYSRKVCNTLLNIQGNYLRALHKETDANFSRITVESQNFKNGSVRNEVFGTGTQAIALLSNGNGSGHFLGPNKEDTGHTATQVMLNFLTSVSGEYLITDVAAGSTLTVINVTATLVADAWIGYAVRFVEGGAIGQSRIITDNSTSSITLDRPLKNSVTTGNELHIRGSCYDTLPWGWGMEVNAGHIDIDSFEKLAWVAELEDFAIGEAEAIDLWALLMDNICSVYGIQLYLSRATGKLTARYIGNSLEPDGLTEDFVSLNSANGDIMKVGGMDLTPRQPLKKITLNLRDSQALGIKPKYKDAIKGANYNAWSVAWGQYLDGYDMVTTSSPSITAVPASIPIVTSDFDDTVTGASSGEMMTVNAMFNTLEKADYIAGMMVSKLKREQKPAPEVELTVPLSFLVQLQPGTPVTLTDQTVFNPYNPLTGSRGWVNLIGRVTQVSFSPQQRDHSMRIRVAIFPSNNNAMVAPAALITGKGNDVNGDYFIVRAGTAIGGTDEPDYQYDYDTLDWDEFLVGDIIEHRDKSGAVVTAGATLGTIQAFGSNQAAVPTSASDGRIYVTGTISGSYTAGDYVTFAPWSTSNSTNMDNYAALADANDTLGSGNDDAKDYG